MNPRIGIGIAIVAIALTTGRELVILVLQALR